MVEVMFPVGPDNSLEFPDYPRSETFGNGEGEPGRAVEGSAERGTMGGVSGIEGTKGG